LLDLIYTVRKMGYLMGAVGVITRILAMFCRNGSRFTLEQLIFDIRRDEMQRWTDEETNAQMILTQTNGVFK
jgi:hypothetical protein